MVYKKVTKLSPSSRNFNAVGVRVIKGNITLITDLSH
jgi:hypothetical protein